MARSRGLARVAGTLVGAAGATLITVALALARSTLIVLVLGFVWCGYAFLRTNYTDLRRLHDRATSCSCSRSRASPSLRRRPIELSTPSSVASWRSWCTRHGRRGRVRTSATGPRRPARRPSSLRDGAVRRADRPGSRPFAACRPHARSSTAGAFECRGVGAAYARRAGIASMRIERRRCRWTARGDTPSRAGCARVAGADRTGDRPATSRARSARGADRDDTAGARAGASGGRRCLRTAAAACDAGAATGASRAARCGRDRRDGRQPQYDGGDAGEEELTEFTEERISETKARESPFSLGTKDGIR